jgi:hypothetical protein
MHSRRGFFWTLAAVSLAAARLLGAPEAGQASPTAEPAWPRLYNKDVYVRDALAKSLDAAAALLTTPKCQSLFSEFTDQRGRALTERLAELKLSLAEYLRAVIFDDGDAHRHCSNEEALAFTTVGSRVVHVCGPGFVRAWRREPSEARATIIHELLHSLGLGENPPSPRFINHRVKELCW